MPKPKPGETWTKYAGRCIPQLIREGKPRAQAAAVCRSMFERKDKAMATDTPEVTEDEAVEASFEILQKDEHPDYTYIRGPVLVPDKIDKQGDQISAEEIEKAAHDYMSDSQRPGLMHKRMLGSRDIRLVESYISRTNENVNGTRIRKGSWVVAWRVYDAKLRKAIREGTLTGFSIGGTGEEDDD